METTVTEVTTTAVGGSGIGDDTGPLISGYGESGAQWQLANVLQASNAATGKASAAASSPGAGVGP